MTDAFSDSPMSGAVREIESEKRGRGRPKKVRTIVDPQDNTPALRSIIDRIIRLEEERKTIGADVKEIYLEAKSLGHEPKDVRKLIKLEMETEADREAREAQDVRITNMRTALGALADLPLGEAAIHTHHHAHHA